MGKTTSIITSSHGQWNEIGTASLNTSIENLSSERLVFFCSDTEPAVEQGHFLESAEHIDPDTRRLIVPIGTKIWIGRFENFDKQDFVLAVTE